MSGLSGQQLVTPENKTHSPPPRPTGQPAALQSCTQGGRTFSLPSLQPGGEAASAREGSSGHPGRPSAGLSQRSVDEATHFNPGAASGKPVPGCSRAHRGSARPSRYLRRRALHPASLIVGFLAAVRLRHTEQAQGAYAAVSPAPTSHVSPRLAVRS